jgi:hypothetical protein
VVVPGSGLIAMLVPSKTVSVNDWVTGVPPFSAENVNP